jgi:hypothetical protein
MWKRCASQMHAPAEPQPKWQQLKPDEPEPDRETRRLINNIAKLKELEPQIALCRTVNEVEDIRIYTMGIQSYYREHKQGPNALVLWAKRLATLCQIQITKIQELTGSINGTLPKPREEMSHGGTSPQTRQARNKARLLGSLPQDELKRRLDEQQKNGKIEPVKLAEEIRQERKERGAAKLTTPKGDPRDLAKRRERYYRQKAEQQAQIAARKRTTKFSDRYRLYWTREKKLLLDQLNFNSEDLLKLIPAWNRDLEELHKEVKAAEQLRLDAIARLKNKPKKPAEPVGADPADE